jgi:type IV pilus assembly protein PilC
MLRNPQLSWSALAAFSRSMARMMEAGVEIRKSLQTSSRQSPDGRLPGVVANVVQSVASGKTLAEAMEKEGEHFPPLFRDLVSVGEQTGSVPEVFSALAKYYDSRVKQVRDFRAAIAWPVIQLVAAVCIVGLLIFILGLLPAGPDGKPFDVLGLGLYGATGAVTWFISWMVAAGTGIVLWKILSNNPSWQMILHPALLGVPVLGHCMRSFATSRFSWCFALTQQAGMSIKPSLECSLKATANGAFIGAQPLIWQELAAGETLTDALTASKLFSGDYLQVVATAEETGTVPEQLDRLSHLFEEEAQRSMNRLTSLFSGAVWAGVALVVIFFILRIAMIYVGMLNDAVKQAM